MPAKITRAAPTRAIQVIRDVRGRRRSTWAGTSICSIALARNIDSSAVDVGFVGSCSTTSKIASSSPDWRLRGESSFRRSAMLTLDCWLSRHCN